MSDRGGWIVLHRKLLDKPIWFESTAEQKVILITLLLMANHAEKEWEWQGQKYVAKPGQFVTSLPKIVEACGNGISIQNVRTALKRFEKYEFLTDQSTKKNRLITINNWAFYQDNPNDTNRHTNSQLTVNQQSANSQLTSNNNDKQINNVTNNVVVDEQVDPVKKVIRTYEQVLGMANTIIIQNLNYWCQDLSPELVIKALEITSKANARSFKYTEAILRNWEKQGVQTVENADALERQREVQNQQKFNKKPVRQEVVPEWMKNPKVEVDDPDKSRKAAEALRLMRGGG